MNIGNTEKAWRTVSILDHLVVQRLGHADGSAREVPANIKLHSASGRQTNESDACMRQKTKEENDQGKKPTPM
jgi:hypothetical protein